MTKYFRDTEFTAHENDVYDTIISMLPKGYNNIFPNEFEIKDNMILIADNLVSEKPHQWSGDIIIIKIQKLTEILYHVTLKKKNVEEEEEE